MKNVNLTEVEMENLFQTFICYCGALHAVGVL